MKGGCDNQQLLQAKRDVATLPGMKMKIAVLIDCSPIMFWALDIHSFIQPSQPLRGNGPSSDDETDAQGC